MAIFFIAAISPTTVKYITFIHTCVTVIFDIRCNFVAHITDCSSFIL